MVATADAATSYEGVKVGGPAVSNKSCTMLHTSGSQIVNQSGEPVVLKGAALGGMLNMENFITGYSGHEHEHRAQMTEVLGEEKANFFFDRLIHHFFTEAETE